MSLLHKIFGYPSNRLTAVNSYAKREEKLDVLRTVIEYRQGRYKYVFEFHSPGKQVENWLSNLLPTQTLVESESKLGERSNLLSLHTRPTFVDGKEMHMSLIFAARDSKEFSKYGYKDLDVSPRTSLLVLTNKEMSSKDKDMVRKELIGFLSATSELMMNLFMNQWSK